MKINYVLSAQTVIRGLVHSNLQALQRALLEFNTGDAINKKNNLKVK